MGAGHFLANVRRSLFGVSRDPCAKDGAFQFLYRFIWKKKSLKGYAPQGVLGDKGKTKYRDEARHGKAFEGLLNRYFGK